LRCANLPGVVLVVEDEPDARTALAMLLEMEGFTVAAAANGRDALELLRRRPPPCVILLDLMMPVMDGWRFRELQLADPGLASIPVVVVTAADLTQYSAHAFDDLPVLIKPVEPDRLVACVREHCG
jgi:CheY-like chemotaxis protein